MCAHHRRLGAARKLPCTIALDQLTSEAARFPRYTVVERALDLVLHVVAALLAACGIAWLFVVAVPDGGARLLIGLTIYGAGLIGMFAASAAYNSCRPGRTKELLRRVDHAMISVMIAGTCTPFTLSAFPKSVGLLLAHWHGSSPRLAW